MIEKKKKNKTNKIWKQIANIWINLNKIIRRKTKNDCMRFLIEKHLGLDKNKVFDNIDLDDSIFKQEAFTKWGNSIEHMLFSIIIVIKNGNLTESLWTLYVIDYHRRISHFVNLTFFFTYIFYMYVKNFSLMFGCCQIKVSGDTSRITIYVNIFQSLMTLYWHKWLELILHFTKEYNSKSWLAKTHVNTKRVCNTR